MARITDHESTDVKPEGPELGSALAAARPPDRIDVARAVRMNALLEAVVGASPAPVTIGGWILEREVAGGGMGVVYRARSARGEPVALKLLLQDSSSAQARFQREAALLRRVDHPRVVRYVDHGTTEDGRAWLVMEWLEGEDLAARLRRGPLDVELTLSIGLEVAAGLGALHRAGVVHRDIKPANLFLPGGRLDAVKVVDLGVALADGGARLTTTGATLGTPQYMAPEQVHGQASVRTDVYALGAVLWECLSGVPPFRGESHGAVLEAVLLTPPPSLSTIRPDLPPAIDALLGRMLAKLPARRPESMDAVTIELSELLAGRGPAVVVSRGERPAPEPPPTVPPTGELVGRARELGQLRGLFLHAQEDGPILAAVTGPPGIGRSALLGAAAAEWPGDKRVIRCEPGDTGTPYALVLRLLDETVQRFDTAGDPRLLADRLRLAWLDALDTWVAAPFALFLDDLHLADLPSLRMLGLALAETKDAPFALVFSCSAEGVPAFAAGDPRLARIPLEPLGRRALRLLAERWGVTDARVDLALGNPGALLRLASAREATWAPLERLSADERRVARACALAGAAPDTSCVASLLGLAPDDTGFQADLATLVRSGLLETDPLRFPSESARDAVLATCTDEDRRRGAHAMARWLESRHRPEERARYLLEIGAPAEATRCLLRAAREGVAAGEDERTERCLAEAERVAEPNQRGEVALLRAQVAFWRGDVPAAARLTQRALPDLTVGADPWFEAAGIGITALGQQGAHAEMQALVAKVVAVPATSDARIIALCRGLSQLSVMGAPGPVAAECLGREAASAQARAWQARARAALASTESFDASIAAQLDAHRAHVLAGDPRSAAQIGLYLGSWYVWSGAWERAEDAIGDALRTARRLGASYLELWGIYVLGKVRVETDPAGALPMLLRVAAEAGESPRIQAGARLYAALAASRLGEHDEAATLAGAAEAHPSVFRAARAARCRATLAAGRDVAAGEGPEAPAGREVEWDELIHLALAEVAAARGEDPREPLRVAADRIRARAATLKDPLRRNDFLARPHLVTRTLEWEAELGESDAGLGSRIG